MKLAYLGTIIIILALIVLGLYSHSFYKIELQDMRINEIKDFSMQGFTLSGNVDVYNGGLMKVGIKKIDYTVLLEKNELATGTIEGKKILPKQTISLPIETRVNWIPSADLALKLLQPGNSQAKIVGTVHVTDSIQIFFEKDIELEQYLKLFLEETITQEIANNLGVDRSTVQKIADQFQEQYGNILDKIN